MTLEQQESLTRELNGAMDSGDIKRILAALGNVSLASMDCQRKTGQRVKSLGWRFTLALVSLASSGGFAAGKWEIIQKIIFGG